MTVSIRLNLSASKESSQEHGCCVTVVTQAKTTWSIIQNTPSVAIYPLLLLAVLLAPGIWGIITAAQHEADSQRDKLEATAQQYVQHLAKQLLATAQPVFTLAMWIQTNPYWPTISAPFPKMAASMLGEDLHNSYLLMGPQYVVKAVYPHDERMGQIVGYDNLEPATGYREAALAMLNQEGKESISGPYYQPEFNLYGITVAVPVFIDNSTEDETFGIPFTATDCPKALCFNATSHRKFWGMVWGTMNLTSLFTGTEAELTMFRGQYRYRLTVVAYGVEKVVSHSDDPLSDPILATAMVLDREWRLHLSPSGSWMPRWRDPVLAVSIVAAFTLSFCLFATLLSRRQHQALLEALLPRDVIEDLKHHGTIGEAGLEAKDSMDSGTPAEKILNMMGYLLQGQVPPLQDVVLVRTAVLRSYNIYQPVNLAKRMRGADLENDVAQALIRQLGGSPDSLSLAGAEIGEDLPLRQARSALTASFSTTTGRSFTGREAAEAQAAAFGTLECALRTLLALPGSPAAAEGPGSDMESGVGQALASSAHPRASWSIPSTRSSMAQAGQLGGSLHNSHASGRSHLLTAAARQNTGHSLGPCPSEDGSLPCVAAGASPFSPVPENWVVQALGLQLPPRPLLEEVEQVLADVDLWQYDSFRLYEVTGGHPLSTLAYFLMHRSELIATFKLNPAKLARYLRFIEDGYRRHGNPYHNEIHAADVLRTMHVIVTRGGLTPGYADPLTHMACYLVAAIHDFEHLGLTNDFLINSGHSLALQYNDRSPLENHHLAAAFKAMRHPGLSFLDKLPPSDMAKLRKLAIEMVMATDMKQHFAIVSHFSSVHRLAEAPAAPTAAARCSTETVSASDGARPTGGTLVDTDMDMLPLPTPIDEAERLLSLQMALKCADLGHLAAALPVHERWVQCLEEEFFRQGDKEVASGMPISPLFDRSKQGASKSQVGFFDFVVLPMFSSFSRVFPRARPLLAQLNRNYAHWAAMDRARQRGQLAQPAAQAQSQAPAQAAAKLDGSQRRTREKPTA